MTEAHQLADQRVRLRLIGAPSSTVVANVLLSQAGWFACVTGAAHGWGWLGPAVATAVVAWHVARAAEPRLEAALIGLIAFVGASFETVMVRSGWVRFDAGVMPFEGVAPVWMVALWALFATNLNVSLRALHGRWQLAALLGAIGGPLAYLSGARLGALQWVDAGAALAAIAIGWATLMPLLLLAARRLDGYRDHQIAKRK